MTVLYVDSNQPGAGKTALATSIASEIKNSGKRALLFKPFANPDDLDPKIYHYLLNQTLVHDSTKISGGDIDNSSLKKIVDTSQKLYDDQDILIIEGTTELAKKDKSELVKKLDAKILFVARYTSTPNIPQLVQYRDQFGDHLLGIILNRIHRFRINEVNKKFTPEMESKNLNCIGVIPEHRRLLGMSIKQISDYLNGYLIGNQTSIDEIVDYFMVGGLGLDSGEEHFNIRQDKAVIVRGDRPDIQMAALKTPTICMILTGGVEPIEYVRYEASQEEVPLVIVPSNTLDTMESLEALSRISRFDHLEKLKIFVELLKTYADLSSVYSSIGLTSQNNTA